MNSTYVYEIIFYSIRQMKKFEASKVLDVLSRRPITNLCAPPTLFKSMIQEKSLTKYPYLKKCFGAGESVSPEVSRVWESKTGRISFCKSHERYFISISYRAQYNL
jgi:acyl-coenzyme A synthetase/AMP-(fatty) acid ligase